MRDHGLPIALDDIDLAFDEFVDWNGVDFLENTKLFPGTDAQPATSERRPDNMSDQARAMFRTVLITSVLEADAMVKSQAFQEWLNTRQTGSGAETDEVPA